MMKKIDEKKVWNILFIICLVVVAVLEFEFHRAYTFIRDDLWYATNLVTGEPLAGIKDVIESQIWHFMNWGGRNVGHAWLQLVLMIGEKGADILNMIVTFLLSYLICELAGKKNLKYYCLAFFSLIALNTDFVYSMFWQSGSANYLHMTNVLLLFLIVYLRQVKNPQLPPLKGCALWMIPLGLATGWSNENMGPACFCTALIVVIYYMKGLKDRPPLWMWTGLVASLCGSILVVTAPGNFVRSTHVTEATIGEQIYDKFFMMFQGAFSFLFPALLLIMIFMYLYLRLGNKLQPFQVILMCTFVLGYGAMFLSPTFPNRAAFGLMVLCIVLIISFINGVEVKSEKCGRYISVFILTLGLVAYYLLSFQMGLHMVGIEIGG